MCPDSDIRHVWHHITSALLIILIETCQVIYTSSLELVQRLIQQWTRKKNPAVIQLGLIFTDPFRRMRIFVRAKLDRVVSVSLPVAAGKQRRANVFLIGYNGDMKADQGGARTTACLGLRFPPMSHEWWLRNPLWYCDFKWYRILCFVLINNISPQAVFVYQGPLVPTVHLICQRDDFFLPRV